jgi:hypothetical protein
MNTDRLSLILVLIMMIAMGVVGVGFSRWICPQPPRAGIIGQG